MNQPAVELQELLLALGYNVPTIVISTWTAKQRNHAWETACERITKPHRPGRRRSFPFALHLERFAVPKKVLAYLPSKMTGYADLNP